jgi:hypothetical protein
MVLKEWGEIRQLYTECTPRVYTLIRSWHKARVYWYVSALTGLLLLLVLVGIFDFVSSLFGYPSSIFGYPTSAFGYATGRLWVFYFCMNLALLILWLVHLASEKVFAREFEILYTRYTYCISRRNFFGGKQLRIL